MKQLQICSLKWRCLKIQLTLLSKWNVKNQAWDYGQTQPKLSKQHFARSKWQDLVSMVADVLVFPFWVTCYWNSSSLAVDKNQATKTCLVGWSVLHRLDIATMSVLVKLWVGFIVSTLTWSFIRKTLHILSKIIEI